MAKFDISNVSDEDLLKIAKTTPSSPKSYGLDKMTDEELAAIAFPTEQKKESFGKGLLRGSIEQLPTAGALFGGAGGLGVGGPVGAVAGAGAGAAAGESLKTIAKKYLLGEEPTREDIYLNPIKQGIMGATGEGAGQLIGKAVSSGSRGLSEYLLSKQKPNAQEIIKATEALGAKATPGQVSKDVMVTNLQSSLEQSPSIAGVIMRKQTQPVREAVKTGASDVFKGVPAQQASDIGSKIKQDIIGQIQNRVKDAGKIYETVRASTEFIDVDPKSLQRVSKNIASIPKFASDPSNSLVQGFAADLQNVKTVDDLKELRSLVGKSRNRFLDGTPEKASINMIYDKLSNLEENTIMREAVKQSRAGGMRAQTGEKIGSELVGQLKQANKDYAGIFKDIGFLSKQSGISKNKPKAIQDILNKLEDIPDEVIGEKLMKTTDRRSLERLKALFPDQFEQLKNQKLDFIRKNSIVRGDVDPVRLLSNVKDMEPQTQQLLFGDKSKEIIDNLRTVVNSLPPKIGASDTPRGIEWMNFLNPLTYPGELARLGQLGIIKMKSGNFQVPQFNMTQGTSTAIGQGIASPVIEGAIERRKKFIEQSQGGR